MTKEPEDDENEMTRAHYARVSPASDTLEQVRARIIDNAVREIARQERDRLFLVVTPENFEVACAWFEARVVELKEQR